MNFIIYTHSTYICGFKNVFKQVMMNEFDESSKEAKKGGDLTYSKRDLKYANKEGLG